MKLLVLAGGLGTRLKSVVQNVPKPMAPIQNRPFLEYFLDYWLEYPISSVYLLTCHLASKIESHFNGVYRGKKVHCIKEPKPLGTGGALLYALDHIPGDEDLVVVNGDTFFEFNFEKMLDFHQGKRSSLTIGLREVQFNDRYTGVQLGQSNSIEYFSKREKGSKELLINAGVYLLKPSFLKASPFEKGNPASLEDDVFPYFAGKDSVYGFVAKGKFIDIGIPTDYEKAQHFFS